ncbi:MAG: hypothetical protein ACYTGO_20255, partial [Planctomycetota bacterium]
SNTRHVFASLALRRSQTTSTNYARSWTNVTVTLADMDYTKVSDTYTTNMISTPTQVFSAKVSWPGHTGAPTTKPAPWGNFAAPNDVYIPFRSRFLHSGKWGTCVDFRFRGGTLGNSGSWTSLQSYYHDGIANNNQSTGGSTSLTSSVSGCQNGYFVVWLFSDKLAGGKAQHRGQPYTFSGLANTQHIGVIGIDNGSTTGTPFPGSCHALYLDLTKPYVLMPYKTDATGAFVSQFLTVPFLSAAVGKTVWSQAGYDSKGLLELTRAGSAPIAALPTTTPVKYQKWIYRYGSTAHTAQYGYGPTDTYVPILYLQ